ncbi:ABC transporter ATP-binding protein [Candidatus Magnetominusculus xianensis]|uniref:ABC transporter ATP-binding protein n=1 Tax=Candidatus Magnetominusculus xianensis TaxID=1748249 RepID=A0ABR5SL13_9BACT|nr:ABC transporter ATP-binding protein [Candidatus Magnetominusculus xianensis]KWT91023.1 ABC transporter ATP-binding protein [Candidatus Magnetominusculus xianensis]MBF0402584.1 ABC transporter ATP-binding protein [Nitrospirota bacterium]
MESAIEVLDLVTYYGERKILKGISFSIPTGMTTVIVGGSGCGKTTTLKHLIGLLRPASGSIHIHGKDIATMDDTSLDEYRKKMGVLFQGAALLNSMTLAENVALPLREHTRLKGSVIDIIVRMKLDLVGLSGFGDFYPAQLSGGMKKRAGIARAMAMDPVILYFDEPSAGLDPVTAAGLDELILRLHQVFKMTVVVVTHELPSIFKIADYVIMLDKGEVAFVGTLDEFKKSDKTIVRTFLERRPEEESYSPDNYFKIITGA